MGSQWSPETPGTPAQPAQYGPHAGAHGQIRYGARPGQPAGPATVHGQPIGAPITPYPANQLVSFQPDFMNLLQSAKGLDINGGQLGQQANAALQPSLAGGLGGYNFQAQNAAQASQQFAQPGQQVNAPGQVHSGLTDAYTQNYFQQGIAAPMMRNYQQNIAPKINEGFAGQGASWNTRRGYAHEQALTDMNTQMGAQLSAAENQNNQLFQQQEMQGGLAHNDQLMQAGQFNSGQQQQANLFNAQQGNALGQFNAGAQNQMTEFNDQQRQRQVALQQNANAQQMQASGMAQQYADAPFRRLGQQQALISPYQQLDQQLLNNRYQQWQNVQPYNNPYMKDMMGFVGTPMSNSNFTQNASPLNIAGQAFGAANYGAQAMGYNNFGGALAGLFGGGAGAGGGVAGSALEAALANGGIESAGVAAAGML